MNWKTDYPAQYYAYSNPNAMLGGYPTVGWVDISIFTAKPEWLPAASAMIALTPDQWNNRGIIGQIVKDGAICDYVAPAPATAAAT